jgi:hypothetical protein
VTKLVVSLVREDEKILITKFKRPIIFALAEKGVWRRW